MFAFSLGVLKMDSELLKDGEGEDGLFMERGGALSTIVDRDVIEPKN